MHTVTSDVARLFPLASREYCGDSGDGCDVRVEEGFVVRYDEQSQRELDVHHDGYMLSFNIALSRRDEYTGLN